MKDDYQNYNVRVKRARGIDEQILAIQDIIDLEHKVEQNVCSIIKKYFYKKRTKIYKNLINNNIPIVINCRYQATNCAYESMLQFNKMKIDYNKCNKLSFKSIYKFYNLVKEFYK